MLEASPILVSSKIGGRDEMREGLVIKLLNRREEKRDRELRKKDIFEYMVGMRLGVLKYWDLR